MAFFNISISVSGRSHKKGLFLLIILCIHLPINQVFAQTLSYYEMMQNGGGVQGLDGAHGVVLSPDGKHLYTASSTDDAVSVFSRDVVTGALSFVETHLDHSKAGGTIDGLLDAKRLTISGDGKHIYVPSSNDDALVVFSRNSTTGTLTYIETHKDEVAGIDGLNGAHEVAVSPDGLHVYIAGYVDDAVAVFSRNTTTGELTFVEVKKDGEGGVDGLNNCRGIFVAPNGNHVYVASATDDAIAVFSRNSTTGALTYVEHLKNNLGGVEGLNGAYSVFVSHDDKNVYVCSYNDDAVAVFTRNPTSGTLTYLESHKDDSQTGGTIPSLNAARYATGTSDGAFVFVVSSSDHSICMFSRNTTNGALTYESCKTDGLDGVDGINAVRVIALSNDDKNIYTVSTGDDAVTNFSFDASLPIELSHFDLKQIQRAVQLSWITNSEINNDFFTIERSSDTQNWETIKQVNGAGTSIHQNSYQILDENPFIGMNYYRLKQTDFDGAFTYSDIKLIEFDELSKKQLNLFPNPTHHQITIKQPAVPIRTFEIYNLLGQNVSNKIGTIELNDFQITLDISQLIEGIYFFKTDKYLSRIYKQ